MKRQHGRFRHNGILLSILVVLLSVVPGASAAESSPTTRPTDLTLAEPYVDRSFGFTIAAPISSTITREKKLADVADVEIVQFGNLQQQWTLTVRYTITSQPLDVKSVVDGITRGVGTRFSDVKVLRGDERIDAREAVRYAGSFVGSNSTWLRQQAVIRTKPTEYFAIVFITPFADREWAEKLFDKVLNTFRIVRTEAMTKKIDEGLKNGRKLFAELAGGKVKLSDRIVPESFMRFIVDGQEVGYVWIREKPLQHNKHTGIEIQELGWLFNDDGAITLLRHEMQLTDDLTFESWKNRVYTLAAPKGADPRQLMYNLDSGGRQDRQLIVAFMPVPNALLLQDRVLEVDDNYASAAWHSLMSRVMDLKHPQLYAFSSFDSDRRGMVLRTAELMGPTTVTIAGRSMRLNKLQSSEGLMDPVSEINVDDKGRILRIKAGRLEMVTATKAELQPKYAKKVSEAEAIIQKYPIHEPQPAAREAPRQLAPAVRVKLRARDHRMSNESPADSIPPSEPASVKPVASERVDASKPTGFTEAGSDQLTSPERVKAYHRTKRTLHIVELVITLVYWLIWVTIAGSYVGWLGEHFASRWAVLGLAALTMIGSLAILELPLSYYSGYIVEQRYGLSNQTPRAWFLFTLKAWMLGAIIGGIVLGGLYILLWFGGTSWSIWLWVGMMTLSVVLAKVFPLLILPLFYPSKPLERPSLTNRLEQMAGGTGLRLTGVFNLELSKDTKKANAMLAGLGSSRRVYLADTLLEAFSEDEIAVVFAHELGHHIRGHIYKGIALSAVVSSILVALIHWRLNPFAGSSADWHQAIARFADVMLLASVYPLLISPITNAISRRFEYQCDSDALRITDNPQAYRSAFERLGAMNLADPNPPRWEEILFDDHPALAKRIAAADRYERASRN